ncbi:MAG: Peptide deformylase [Legionellaceae bacterium]
MAIRTILHFPDQRLRKKAEPVTEVTSEIKTLIEDMFDTLYHDKGIGLAATQINIQQRIFVTDLSDDKSEKLCFINPEILVKEGQEEMQEGCLSVPGIYEKVTRAEKIKVKALDRNGNSFELETDGLLAVCIQHEIDHLDGKLFVDYLSPLKFQRIQKKLQKIRQQTL